MTKVLHTIEFMGRKIDAVAEGYNSQPDFYVDRTTGTKYLDLQVALDFIQMQVIKSFNNGD